MKKNVIIEIEITVSDENGEKKQRITIQDLKRLLDAVGGKK